MLAPKDFNVTPMPGSPVVGASAPLAEMGSEGTVDWGIGSVTLTSTVRFEVQEQTQ